MQLLKTSILLLATSLILMTACEPTYEEITNEQLDLLFSKKWVLTDNDCIEDTKDFTIQMNFDSDGSVLVEYTYSTVDSDGTSIDTTDSFTTNWFSNNYTATTSFLGFYVQLSLDFIDDNFNLLSISENQLVLAGDYDCIYTFK